LLRCKKISGFVSVGIGLARVDDVQNLYSGQRMAINDDVIGVAHKLMRSRHANSAIVSRENAKVVGVFDQLRGKLGAIFRATSSLVNLFEAGESAFESEACTF
jgi:hypothetical protein